jgi:hypothetical protein
VFENRELRRIFAPEREEVAGGWKGLHSEEFHSLDDVPNVNSVFMPRSNKSAGHIAGIGKGKVVPVLFLTEHRAMKAY